MNEESQFQICQNKHETPLVYQLKCETIDLPDDRSL